MGTRTVGSAATAPEPTTAAVAVTVSVVSTAPAVRWVRRDVSRAIRRGLMDREHSGWGDTPRVLVTGDFRRGGVGVPARPEGHASSGSRVGAMTLIAIEWDDTAG